MRKAKYRQIASKALKTTVLANSHKIAPYIPETQWYQPETLFQMIEKYPMIFLKPDKGTGGGGIIRIRRISNDRVEYQGLSGKQVVKKQHLPAFLVKRFIPNQRYLIQRGISLAHLEGRPFDIRVLLQKPKDQWMISGMAAKVAAPGKIVTNYCKGGRPCEISKALTLMNQNDHEKAKKIFVELYYLSKEIAKILNRRFVGLRELGIDVGIDKQNKIWIFEVNTHPNFQMFRKLANKQIYQRIRNVHKQWV